MQNVWPFLAIFSNSFDIKSIYIVLFCHGYFFEKYSFVCIHDFSKKKFLLKVLWLTNVMNPNISEFLSEISKFFILYKERPKIWHIIVFSYFWPNFWVPNIIITVCLRYICGTYIVQISGAMVSFCAFEKNYMFGYFSINYLLFFWVHF